MDRPYTLLVVDDDPLITRTLARQLAGPDRRVIAVNDPLAALAAVAAEPVDLVISDKDMPEMTGLALLAAIRDQHPHIVRILLTGRATLDSAITAINEHGVFRYLTKPWDEAELTATIAAALGRVDELRRAQHVAQLAARRQARLDELAAADPRLLDPTGAVHLIPATPIGDQVDDLVRRLHGGGAAADEARPGVEAMTGRVGAVALADALALVPVRHLSVSVRLDSRDEHLRVAVEIGATSMPLVWLARPLGDQVAARLAVLGGLDPGIDGEQLGRLVVRGAGTGVDADLMVAHERTPRGPAVELRRLVRGTDALAAAHDDFVGRYKILDRLGEGGMGTVYRAVHTSLDRPVAVKVLRAAAAREPVAVARFLREARAATQARHPGIVEILDHGQLADGRPFLVMELVAWPTLEARLDQGPIAVADAIEIARGLAVALGAAHDAGIVHRDLKPGNVFVDDDRRVKIADFGAAKVIGAVGPALTQHGWTIGTPTYMAPEQATARAVDRRSDIYALGCILFEMLTGDPPFRAPTPREVLAQHLSAPLPPVAAPGRDIPPVLAAIVHRALAKAPAARQQTSAELAAELDQVARHGGRQDATDE